MGWHHALRSIVVSRTRRVHRSSLWLPGPLRRCDHRRDAHRRRSRDRRHADEEQGWYASFTIEAAPPGEYAVFSSPTRPTSLAGLADLDLASCTASSWSAPGLGTFDERVELDASGRLKVGGWSGANTSKNFFVLVRRGPALDAPLTVRSLVTIEGNAGCGGSNPDPPSRATSSLDGAPPLGTVAAGMAPHAPSKSNRSLSRRRATEDCHNDDVPGGSLLRRGARGAAGPSFSAWRLPSR